MTKIKYITADANRLQIEVDNWVNSEKPIIISASASLAVSHSAYWYVTTAILYTESIEL